MLRKGVGSHCAINCVASVASPWVKRKEIGSMSNFFISDEE
jgi:hypothetical protein